MLRDTPRAGLDMRDPEGKKTFDVFERAQRRRVEPGQRQVQLAAHSLVPASRPGPTARNALLRVADLRRRQDARSFRSTA